MKVVSLCKMIKGTYIFCIKVKHLTQPANTCSKVVIETLEKNLKVKYLTSE